MQSTHLINALIDNDHSQLSDSRKTLDIAKSVLGEIVFEETKNRCASPFDTAALADVMREATINALVWQDVSDDQATTDHRTPLSRTQISMRQNREQTDTAPATSHQQDAPLTAHNVKHNNATVSRQMLLDLQSQVIDEVPEGLIAALSFDQTLQQNMDIFDHASLHKQLEILDDLTAECQKLVKSNSNIDTDLFEKMLSALRESTDSVLCQMIQTAEATEQAATIDVNNDDHNTGPHDTTTHLAREATEAHSPAAKTINIDKAVEIITEIRRERADLFRQGLLTQDKTAELNSKLWASETGKGLNNCFKNDLQAELAYLFSPINGISVTIGNHGLWRPEEHAEIVQNYLYSIHSFDDLLSKVSEDKGAPLNIAERDALQFFAFGCDYRYLQGLGIHDASGYIPAAIATKDSTMIARGFDYQADKTLEFLSNLGILPQDRAATLGGLFCGEGSLTRAVARRETDASTPALKAFGVDGDKKVLALAQELCPSTDRTAFYEQNLVDSQVYQPQEKADLLLLSAPSVPKEADRRAALIENIKCYAKPGADIVIGFKMNKLVAGMGGYGNDETQNLRKVLAENADFYDVKLLTAEQAQENNLCPANRLIADSFSSVLLLKRKPDTST